MSHKRIPRLHEYKEIKRLVTVIVERKERITSLRSELNFRATAWDESGSGMSAIFYDEIADLIRLHDSVIRQAMHRIYQYLMRRGGESIGNIDPCKILLYSGYRPECHTVAFNKGLEG